MPIHIDAQWSIPHAMSALAECSAITVTTSGSTGVAKDITISRSALVASALASNERINARKGATWSLLLPLTHVAGINVLMRAGMLGTTPIDLRIEKNYSDVDFTAIVPTQLHRALTGDDKLLAHLQAAQCVLVGGAPLTAQERLRAEKAGIRLVTTYGMTETCGGCIYDGEALTGVEFKLMDSIIYLRGTTLAEVPLIDGWFQTSDFGRVENNRLVVDGRRDDQIISGGEKISLSTIENALQSYFSSEFAAYSRQDGEWGEMLCVAKVSDIDDGLISKFLKDTFGTHASPKKIVKVNTIPLIGIGKPDRKKLSEE